MEVLKSPLRPWGDTAGNKIQHLATREAAISTRKYGESGLLIRSIYYEKIAPPKDHQYVYDPCESSVEVEGQASTKLNRDDLCYQPEDLISSYPIGGEVCWSSEFENGFLPNQFREQQTRRRRKYLHAELQANKQFLPGGLSGGGWLPQ